MIDPTIILDYSEPISIAVEEESTLVQVADDGESLSIEPIAELREILSEGVPTVDLIEVGAYVFNSVGGGGGGTTTLSREEFVVATTGQVLYPLTGTPGTGQKIVFINGLSQPASSYTVVGQSLTFTSGIGITAGDRVGIYYT